MKTPSHIVRIVASVIAIFAAVPLVRAQQFTNVWTGGGGANDLFWLDGVNWQGGSHPPTGAELIFTNTVGLINSNNYPAGQIFSGFTFATPSGAFALSGASVTLTNNITDLQPVTSESINLPVILGGLNGSVNVAVTTKGVLNLNSVVSGTGLTSSGAGTVNLNGTNTFTGPLMINAGTVAVVADTNLGLANIVLNGGTLQTLTTMTLNSNRTITVGSPSSAGGSGTIQVITNTLTITAPVLPTLTYDGVIANNTGGASGLNKLGFGTLTLFGQNTYTGTTSNEVGTLTLDFSQTALTASIINSASKLVLGGAISGGFGTNYAQLIVTGKASTTDSQTFNGTHLTFGASQIQANPGAGGTVNLTLGTLDHDQGSVVVVQPPSLTGGTGNVIAPSTANTGGILGGWATIGQPVQLGYVRGTNWASLDGSGNIINFNNFFNYTTNMVPGTYATLHSLVDANTTTVETNLLINTATPTTCLVDNPGAGTMTDINSIKFGAPTGSLPPGSQTATPGDAVVIGAGNTLRLGVYGGVLKEDVGGEVCFIGGTNNNTSLFFNLGVTNSQDVGTLTAGGPNPNTPGEIVCNADGPNNTGGTIQFACQIVDNGLNGPVTFIKTGAGSIKLAGHNTYSGGLYILQGRVQFDGSEIGTNAPVTGVTSGNLNPGAGGTGPIYVLPGCYLFLNSTTVAFPFTNQLYIAGCGDGSEPLGAVRGGIFAGPVTMIGDTDLGGGPTMLSAISGPFNLTLGSQATVNGGAILCNTNDNWTGNTIMIARNNTGNNTVTMSNSFVIPSGSGFGNVSLQAFNGAGSVWWNLNGFNQTINGFSSVNASLSGANTVVTNCVVTNSSATASALTLGNNDQSGLWGGNIAGGSSPGNGTINLTKIGAGIETLTNINTYVGTTTISNGVLQLIGGGSIASSPNVTINGGTFDVSSVSYTIPAAQNININGGTFFINTGTTSSGGSVSFNNGTLEITTLSGSGNGTGTPNLTVPTLNISGVNNFIQPASMPPIPNYPAVYPVIKYTTLIGSASTFSPILPAGGFPAFGGYISNANNTIYLVLTNGPVTPQLTWFGSTGGSLDSAWNLVDNDWTNAPAGHLASYSDGSLLIFDDTAKTNVVSLNIDATPLGITITNVNLNYTLVGNGGLHGASTNFINKTGTGKLTLDNLGTNDFNDAVSIDVGGTVQVGVNDTGGGLGTGTLANNGTVVFNRNNATLTIPNAISGTGGILLSNPASTTTILSGNNSSYGGSVYVAQGITFTMANLNALSMTNGSVTIPTGSTLDFSGLSAASSAPVVGKMVYVAGAGVDGTSGAIVNNVATNQDNALLRVTLTNDTTFGGTGSRWDIRGSGTQPGVLSTGGHAYNITKKGSYFMSIANINVDSSLSNIDVQGGVLEVNGSTTGLGTSGMLTIESTAGLQLYNMTNTMLNKSNILNGDGTDITLNNALGNNTVIGAMTLNSTVIVAGNATLTLSNSIGGAGSLNENSTNNLNLVLAGSSSYNGGTMVNGGTFIINGINNSTGTQDANQLTAAAGTTVGGSGTYTVPVDIEGVLWPGVSGKPSTLSVGNNVDYEDNSSDTWGALSFGGFGGVTTNIFSLNSTPTAGGGINDLINVTGDLYANGAAIFINPLGSLQTGNTYTLVNYSGSKISSYSGTVLVAPAVQPSRYQFNLNQGSGNNSAVTLTVSTGAGTMEWNNAAGNSVWDVATTLNWTNTGTATPVNPTDYQFYQEDSVVLDDSIANTAGNTTLTITNAAVTNNIITALLPTTITVNSTNNNYTINGVGKISGNVNIIKKGPSMFTIANTNDFTGTILVTGGSLRVDNTNALGSVNTTVTVTNGGTLDFGGPDLTANIAPLVGARAIYISGWGVNSNGCLINSSTNLAQEDAAQNVIMTGDAAIGGNAPINAGGRFDLGRLPSSTLSTGGHAYNLYKVGTNQVSLVGVTVDPALNNVDIRGGELGFETGSTWGNPAGTVTVESNAVLEFFETTNTMTKALIVNGGSLAQGTYENVQFNGGGIPNNSISGPITITNGMVVIGGGASGTISNAISGPSPLTIAGVVHLDGTNTYTGNTTVSNTGTMFLDGTASIATTPNITLGGGTIDVSGRTNTTLTLGGQTLTGGGTVNGSLSNLVGSTVAPSNGGSSSTNNLLTVTTNATLLGTTIMNLNGTNNDVLAVTNGNVAYGGTLTVTTNASGTTTLTAGENFQLFEAATYSGTFSTLNLPTLPASLLWDTSQLTVSGTIKVVSSTPSVPHITGIVLSGTTLTITATNGSDGGSWTLLQSTNVSLPLSQWQTNIQGTFDGSGDLSTNIANTVSNTQEFYILKQ